MKNEVIRQCKSCRSALNRENLIKITLQNGELHINPSSKITGRSVYVCKNPNCILKLIKTKGIKKSLRFNDEQKIEAIVQELQLMLHEIQEG